VDRKEIYYLCTLDPLPAIQTSVAHAVAAFTGVVDGEIACIFGVTRRSRLSAVGVPWLLGTDALDAAPATFMRHSRVYFERMQQAFPLMENYVLAENTKTVKWLRWLGFEMEPPAPYGAFGEPFIRFGKGLAKCV